MRIGEKPTLAVGVRHGDVVVFPPGQERKRGQPVHPRRHWVAVKLRLGKNTAADAEAVFTIRDVEGRHWRMMGYLEYKATTKDVWTLLKIIVSIKTYLIRSNGELLLV